MDKTVLERHIEYYDALSAFITNYIYDNGGGIISYEHKKCIMDINMLNLKNNMDDSILFHKEGLKEEI